MRGIEKSFRLSLTVLAGLLLAGTFLFLAKFSSQQVQAAPIPPPDGYPKFTLSTKSVTPTLALPGGATLKYEIEIVNTGAYAGKGVTLVDPIPANTTYNNDAQSSSEAQPKIQNGALTWTGDVGFDSSVTISFSVDVAEPSFMGVITNTAVISHPLIEEPIETQAQTMVTDQPILEIEKTAAPDVPGPNKVLTYTLSVTNLGQPATALPMTVVDKVPADTTFSEAGPNGAVNASGDTVAWKRTVDLDTGASSLFTFTVTVDDVFSGTVINNRVYRVSSGGQIQDVGEPYTVTVLDPILKISKYVEPEPPGSNREFTYTINILNQGSLATDLVVTDQIPDGVTYVSGGTNSGNEVRWTIPELDTGETASVSYQVSVGDVAGIAVVNDTYKVCSAEQVCQSGKPVTSTIEGPNFEALVSLDPIAKKPGSHNDVGPVTPTIVIRNLGPGNALDASADFSFEHISVVNTKDLLVIPDKGTLYTGPDCGENCNAYRWVGDLSAGEAVTLTTNGGQSTIGGDEGQGYTATVTITDAFVDSSGVTATVPISASAVGRVTHFANLIPVKTSPTAIGPGQILTYTIQVGNSGLSTDSPPYPVLSETLPPSTTLHSVSDDGVTSQVGGGTVISWTLPDMSPGDVINRYFSVVVDKDLVSGTLIVNDQYRTEWYDIEASGVLSNTGEPFTTTVKDIGLVDSFKTVDPALVRPGPDNLLTYTVHVVNSSPSATDAVEVYDLLPWEHSTYQRDAVASSGEVISDIVSVSWTGDVAPFSEELITFTVLVDPDYEGPLTNTATINDETLKEPVEVQAVAYATNDPVLRLYKKATPDPAKLGGELLYTIRAMNLGQQATNLVLTDLVPENTQYVNGSANSGGTYANGTVRWEFAVLRPGEERLFTFKVKVLSGKEVLNAQYEITSAEGASYQGEPLLTLISNPYKKVYLPLIP